jgi:hypothetical protein
MRSIFNQEGLHKISHGKERIVPFSQTITGLYRSKRMEPKPNPIRKRGERNIYCPFYSDCLDHAVIQFWQYWSCSQCPYRKIKSFEEVEYGANEGELDYECSPDIVKEITGKGSRQRYA